MNQSLWYKDAVFYQVYVRAFRDSNGDGHGDIPGLTQKLDYLQELGVDCIWLMPIYPSPLKDDGYDIADFYNIAERFGTVDDFKALVEAAHRRDIRIIMDLVLNHTSDQHPWFQASRADRNSPYREYYVWSDTDQQYKDARIIFLDTEPSNWTWDEQAGQYYWHRFYASQPDLNYDSPKVQEEMLKVAAFWLELGIDGFRADAVPYLFEREGTNCENLPETHTYLKKLRTFIDDNYPGRILLCEANQWPEDVRPYFGDGDEFQMGFHFPIMPRIYMALKKGRGEDMLAILRRTPPIPENCQWCIFLRNHDELTLEMVTEEERQWMWEQYAPEQRMRLNLGIRRRLAPLLDKDERKIRLAYSLLFTLPGSPILYYGDEIGMGDNIWLDDRNGVRTPMQWEAGPAAGFSEAPLQSLYAPVIESETYNPQRVNVASRRADPDSLWHVIRKMIAIRQQHSTFGWGSFEWIDLSNNSIAAFQRTHSEETIFSIHNLSDTKQKVSYPIKKPVNVLTELLTQKHFEPVKGNLEIELMPYQYFWLK
ncbi:MAG TPA: maltose alpha-D-glucosyltransferase, partial [Anaerolineales bacterium]|nr:maltose alpha-D-glucosyltransferase [Anaerolineales bacterium]